MGNASSESQLSSPVLMCPWDVLLTSFGRCCEQRSSSPLTSSVDSP